MKCKSQRHGAILQQGIAALQQYPEVVAKSTKVCEKLKNRHGAEMNPTTC